MNITKVYITKLQDNKTKALASITINEEFVVTGLKVMEGQNGLWVSMPSKKNNKPNDKYDDNYKAYFDIAYPITKEAREDIQKAVLAEYTKEPFVTDYSQGAKQNAQSKIDVTEDDLPF